MKRAFRVMPLMSFVVLVPALVLGVKLNCPDTPDERHHREVMATSAPEVKVGANSGDEPRRWAEIVKPLTRKAIKLAKTQRSTLIQEGIERGCNASQQYVGQIIPVGDKSSGCEHRVVTRPADEGHMWVQVIATCKYDWVCCSPESSHAAGYTLEGPLSTSTSPSNPKK